MDHHPDSLEPPPALHQAFRPRTAAPPAELDRAVLLAARASSAGTARKRRLRRLLAPLAAALVLGPRWLGHPSGKPVAPREDLDGNGRVDILDAFQLARELALGVREGADFTHDGRVDEHDVDHLAQLAVRIGS